MNGKNSCHKEGTEKSPPDDRESSSPTDLQCMVDLCRQQSLILDDLKSKDILLSLRFGPTTDSAAKGNWHEYLLNFLTMEFRKWQNPHELLERRGQALNPLSELPEKLKRAHSVRLLRVEQEGARQDAAEQGLGYVSGSDGEDGERRVKHNSDGGERDAVLSKNKRMLEKVLDSLGSEDV